MRAGLLLGLWLLSAGCRFERRPEVAVEQEPFALAGPGAGDERTPQGDSVRAVVAALEVALEVGDISRVVRLTAPGATLLDPAAGVEWTRESAAAPLPRAVSGGAEREPGPWVLEASGVTPLGSAALLVNRYRGAAPTAAGVLVESWVLVRGEPGWVVAHLHRSVAPQEPLPR